MSRIRIANVGLFTPPEPGKIHIACRRCKQTKPNIDRTAFDFEGAAVVVMNYCDRCDKGGGFEDSEYFDYAGKVITPT